MKFGSCIDRLIPLSIFHLRLCLAIRLDLEPLRAGVSRLSASWPGAAARRRRLVGADGLSRFDDRAGAQARPGAIVYAFDLLERDGSGLVRSSKAAKGSRPCGGEMGAEVGTSSS
jgi:hypothetical protein